MNAPHPLLHHRTGNPVDDALRHNDERQADQDLNESMLAVAEQEAPLIMLAKLQAAKRPGDWYEKSICIGGLQSPDEIACDALNHDDDSRDAYAELMTSPAAQKFKQTVAEWFGRQKAMAIYTEQIEERH